MEREKSRSTTASGEGSAESSHLQAFFESNPASTGVLAGVVTMSGQLAAQFDAPNFWCRIVALTFALLLAYYQVGIAQRRPRREALFLVPIVAVILFTAGWGANQLIYERQSRTPDLAFHRAQASLGEWLAQQVIPAAHAQPKDEKKGGPGGQEGGWKSW